MLRRMIALALMAYSIVLLQGRPSSPSVSVPAGSELLLAATGDGAQIYTCTDGHWTLKAPDARLLDEHGQVVGSHFAGPTWRLSDGSEVKGKLIGSQAAADTSSVPWLLLESVPGSGSGKFVHVLYIRRTETHGGAAPATTCSGGELRVSYTAKYSFYTAR